MNLSKFWVPTQAKLAGATEDMHVVRSLAGLSVHAIRSLCHTHAHVLDFCVSNNPMTRLGCSSDIQKTPRIPLTAARTTSVQRQIPLNDKVLECPCCSDISHGNLRSVGPSYYNSFSIPYRCSRLVVSESGVSLVA